MFNLANFLTFSRTLGAVALLFTAPGSVAFFFLYTWCGLTDLVDGTIARKMKTAGKTGALLDSIADLTFIAAVTIILLPVMIKTIPFWSLIGTLAVFLIRTAAYLIGAAKFHHFAALHTISNKVTGGLLFLLPYGLGSSCQNVMLVVILIVAGYSSIEEVICEIYMKEYQPNIKTVFQLGWIRNSV